MSEKKRYCTQDRCLVSEYIEGLHSAMVSLRGSDMSSMLT